MTEPATDEEILNYEAFARQFRDEAILKLIARIRSDEKDMQEWMKETVERELIVQDELNSAKETLRKVRGLAEQYKDAWSTDENLANALRLFASDVLALLGMIPPDLAAWEAASDEALTNFERQLDSRGADFNGNKSQIEVKE